MASSKLLVIQLLATLALAQTPGQSEEAHPKLTTWKCTKAGGCTEQTSAIVLDSLAHPVHQVNDKNKNCGDWGSAPPKDVCPDEDACAKNCIMEGIPDYSSVGVTTEGSKLNLQQLRPDGSLVSPRVYLLAPDEQNYEMLQLTGGEFTFDVDVSKLPCGMNGALYLSEMEANGAKGPLNPGGAYYGTGYCDAQCFTTPFINGVGNIQGKGSCCNEMDIWEANSAANQIAPHTCNKPSLYQCAGDECTANGVCDKNGCGMNPYKSDRGYYGPGLRVDTGRPFTVVTQFPAEGGALKEIRRLYVQDGRVIENAGAGSPAQNFMDDGYCSRIGAGKFMELGAMKGMGDALARGMVLAMSVWWDEGGFMNWLDSGESGPCSATEGDPKVIREKQPDTAVSFSNIKWGEIGSTFSGSRVGRREAFVA